MYITYGNITYGNNTCEYHMYITYGNITYGNITCEWQYHMWLFQFHMWITYICDLHVDVVYICSHIIPMYITHVKRVLRVKLVCKYTKLLFKELFRVIWSHFECYKKPIHNFLYRVPPFKDLQSHQQRNALITFNLRIQNMLILTI